MLSCCHGLFMSLVGVILVIATLSLWILAKHKLCVITRDAVLTVLWWRLDGAVSRFLNSCGGIWSTKKSSIIIKCEKKNIHLARFILDILILTNWAPSQEGPWSKPKDHSDRSNELVGCKIFLEGQQSGQRFTNLGFTADWPGGNDSWKRHMEFTKRHFKDTQTV